MCSRDWSSGVCSSDLLMDGDPAQAARQGQGRAAVANRPCLVEYPDRLPGWKQPGDRARPGRSEERRVGKVCRSRWSPNDYKLTKLYPVVLIYPLEFLP